MDQQTKTELEAAAFRRLLEHLSERTDVQNIDMMNLAGFCRNCLSRWYQEAADERGIEMTKEEGRKAVYGMPFDEFRPSDGVWGVTAGGALEAVAPAIDVNIPAKSLVSGGLTDTTA